MAPKTFALSEAQVNQISRAVADPRRLQILKEISQSERQLVCSDLLAKLPIAAATVSHHLKELEAASLITMERHGKFAYLGLRRDIWEAYLGHLAQI